MLTVLAAVLAISISSDKIDTFMHLPDWFPTSVDAEHTFGSDEHTNCTHRTTLDTLAAVESIFDAYHERVFFFSEGRSNDWNFAKYGPRPYNEGMLNQVEFTNDTRSVNELFVYQMIGTNSDVYPRTVADTRRLVEFDNLFGLSEKLTTRIFDGIENGAYHGIFLTYSPTWCVDYNEWYNRCVYLGSSWMPGLLSPTAFTWREGAFPSIADWPVTNFCLAVYECAPDGVFKVRDDYRGQYASYSFMKEWLESATFGDLYEPQNSSYMEQFYECRPIVTNTIPDVIRSKFPDAGPENAITNLTRRLAPDDYKTYDVTNDYRVIATHSATVDFTSAKDGERGLAGLEYEYDRIDGYSITNGIISSMTLRSREKQGWADDVITSSEVEMQEAPLSYDKITIGNIKGHPSGAYVAEHWYDQLGPWTWSNPHLELDVNYWGYVAVTNAVHTNSSLVATESRVLAMLDRTYELPERDYYSGIVVCTNMRRIVTAESLVSGRIELSHGEDIDYSWVRESDRRYVKRVNGLGSDVVIELSQGPVERNDTTSVIGEYMFDAAKFRYSGVHTGLTPVQYYSSGFDARVEFVSNETHSAGYSYSLIKVGERLYVESRRLDAWDDPEIAPVILNSSADIRINATMNLSQSATLEYTTPPTRDVLDRCYPWYGPGALSFSTGRVRECHCSLLAGILKIVGRRKPDGSFYPPRDIYDEIDWLSVDHGGEDASLLYSAEDSLITHNSLVVSRVVSAIGQGGWARQKLYQTCNDSIGGEFSPSLLNPSLGEIVRNSSRLAKYDGGEYYVEVSPSGPTKWPVGNDLRYGFAVRATGESPDINYEAAFTAPVCADLQISRPLLSTDWNWKALKSERNNP